MIGYFRKNLNHRMRMLWILGFAVLNFVNPAWSGSKNEPLNPGDGQERVYWYEFQTVKSAWISLDELAVFPKQGMDIRLDKERIARTIDSEAVVYPVNAALIYLKLPEFRDKRAMSERLETLTGDDDIKLVSPVFYPTQKKAGAARYLLTGQIIVRFSATESDHAIANIEKKYDLKRIEAFDYTPNTFLYACADAMASLEVANGLYESGQVIYAYPNWLRSRSRRADPDDPLYSDQWHLNNTGQGGGLAGEDANVASVWNAYTGSSEEVIAIVDDGLETAHEDLSSNIISGLSYDYVDGDSDPTGGDHGTSCAGVAAARGFNQIGITGAAPYAGLLGFRLLGAETDANEADALSRENDMVDIYSNSWGPEDDGARLEGPGPLTESAMAYGIENGRNGLGSIYVWAGGNGYDTDNSNYDGYANSRYTISVAASTNQGIRPDYSEKGANVLINAPSDGGTMAIATTDRTGDDGYNPDPLYDDYEDTNYTKTFGGTSSAAPLTAGIIALMLNANPQLSWRDVQQILITTAEKNDPDDEDWTTNGAGYAVNHKYGFGRIDAQAAVNRALRWVSVADEISVEYTSDPNLSIPDADTTGVSDTISVSDGLSVEYVEIFFSAADHSYWGDLEIVLISPNGTESILSEAHFSGGSDSYDNWRFGSVRHFGETAAGDWVLRVRDLESQDTGTFQSWTLKIYGTPTASAETPDSGDSGDSGGGGGGSGCFISTLIGG